MKNFGKHSQRFVRAWGRVFFCFCFCCALLFKGQTSSLATQTGSLLTSDFPDQTAMFGSSIWLPVRGSAKFFTANVSDGFTGVVKISSASVLLNLANVGPVGTHTITVIASGGDGRREQKSFVLTVTATETATGNCALPYFESSTATRAAFGRPFSDAGWATAAMADFDGDGNQDWVGAAKSSRTFRLTFGNRTGGVGSLHEQFLTDNTASRVVWVLGNNFYGDNAVAEFVIASDDGLLISWRYQNGMLTPVQTLSVGVIGNFRDARDLNHDNRADIIFATPGGFGVLLTNAQDVFDAPRFVTLTNAATSYVMGDFNQDGEADLLVEGANLLLLPGLGNGTFGTPVSFNAIGARLLSAADFNQDQLLDLVVYDSAQRQIALLLNDNGGFQTRTNINLESQIQPDLIPQPVAADFNRDGKLDLALSNAALSGVTLLLGNGQGGFGRGNSFGLGNPPLQLFAHDLNRDGKLDIIAPSFVTKTLVALLGDGSGGFVAQRGTAARMDYESVTAVGDLNGDGRQDVVLRQQANDGMPPTITLFAGTAQGTLDRIISLESGPVSVILVADFDRDGRADLITFPTVNEGRLYRSAFARDWSGALAAPVNFTPNGPPAAPTHIADFNGDGFLDWFAADTNNGLVRINLNQAGNGFAVAAEIYTLPTKGSYEVVASDLNRDGLADLIAMQPGGALVLRGLGTGGFIKASQLNVSGRYLQIADFNNDGKRDVVFFRDDTRQTVYGQGDGEGRFGLFALNEPEPDPFTVVFVPMFIGDFNNDGHLDLVNLDFEPMLALGDGRGGFQEPYELNLYAALPQAVADVNGDGLLDAVNLQVSNFGGSLEVMRNLYRCQPPRAAVSVSAATYDSALHAPEMIAALFGNSLATTTAAASTPLPTSLGGTTVNIRDSAGVERLAPLFGVSPTQVNYLVPADIATGVATVTIVTGQSAMSRTSINVASIAPGIFTAESNGKGFPAGSALRINGEGASTYTSVVRFDAVQQRFVGVPINPLPANEAVFLVLYGTGLRQRSALANVTAKVGGLTVPVTYAGAQQTLLGLDQVNLRLPTSLAGRGLTEVTLSIDGRPTNPVQIIIQ